MKPFRQLTIRGKLILALLAAATLVAAAASAAFVLFERLTLESRVRQVMEPYAQLVSVGTEAAVAFVDPRRAREILETLRANPQILAAQIDLADGVLLARYGSDPSRILLRHRGGHDGVYLEGDTAYWVQSLPDGAHLYLVMDLAELNRQTRGALLAFAAGGSALLALVILGLLAALQRVIVSPVSTLAETVERVRAKADYNQRVPVSGSDEVARLGQSFNAMMAAIQQRDGDLRRYQDLLEDTVQQRTAELMQARDAAEAANRTKSVFLAHMSHELRTPLNGILGYAQILRRDETLADRNANALDVISQCGEHLPALIDDILDLTRIETGRLELVPGEVSLATFLRVVAEIVAVKARQKGLEFVSELAPDLPERVRADERRLRQVLLNLLANAVKFTDHGRVVLRVSRVEPGRIAFAVEDSGIGIGAMQQEKIFQPFEQAGDLPHREGGTGLGLTISRQLVRLMGGDITVASREGEGSVFRFELDFPAVAMAPTRDAVSPREARIDDDIASKWAMAGEPTATPVAPAATLIAPPGAEMRELRRLARLGNMGDIARYAEHIEGIDARYRPFAAHLIRLAEAYQSKAILTFVEQYLHDHSV